jgi:CubicO group peptidase (beta-lactamase class C family)
MARQRWRPVAVGLVLTAALVAGCTSAPASDSSAPSVPTPAPSTAETPRAPTGVDYAALQRTVQARLASDPEHLASVRSIVLSVDGRTVMSVYQDRRPTEQDHVWSVTKRVISMLVGIAVEEERLRLDEPLAELLPEHAAVMTPAQQAITLQQLLTMTAGAPADDGGINLEADDPVAQLLAYGMSNDPGMIFAYSNSSAQLVAAVLHRAVGRPILDYAREKLFDPLGIDTRPAWEGTNENQQGGFDKAGFGWAVDKAGTHTGGYGLRLTAPDLVKLGELYLDGGRWRGKQLVPADWVARSTSPQLTPEQQTEGQYGYFWWIADAQAFPVRGFVAAGSWYQRIFVFPARRVVLVVTADDTDVGEDTVGPALEPFLVDDVLVPLLR